MPAATNTAVRTPRELQLHAAVSRLSVLPASAVLATVRTQAAHAALGAGEPVTLRERALHAALRWIAAAPDGSKLAEIRAYAGGALLALDAPVKHLAYWTEYTERRIANGTAAQVLR
jgi:hypothetical protein